MSDFVQEGHGVPLVDRSVAAPAKNAYARPEILRIRCRSPCYRREALLRISEHFEFLKSGQRELSYE